MSDNKLLKAPNREAAVIKLAVFDFDGVFTDNSVWTFANGQEAVRSYRSDGMGLSKLKNLGITIWVVSTDTSSIVKVRCRKLKVNYENGLTDKKLWLSKLIRKLSLNFGQVMYMGNDINDIECMKIVGFPVAVNDAYPEVKKTARFITKRSGGFGAVREICDFVEKCQISRGNVPSD